MTRSGLSLFSKKLSKRYVQCVRYPSLPSIPPLTYSIYLSHPIPNPTSLSLYFLSLDSLSHSSLYHIYLSPSYPTHLSVPPLSPQGLRVDFSIYQRVFAILVKSPNAAQAAVDMLLNIERAAIVTSRIAARVSTVPYDYVF